MQKKKIILLTILILIILSIALLILNTPKPIPQTITEQAKANYTTGIGTQTYDITNTVLEPTDITPSISAGMIPIKWNGANFVITTFEDTNWYNYANGQPAYIMLNDGYYKSELVQGITNDQLMENAVGNDALVVPNVTDNNPTIYMYIPRFAYNAQGEILYIKQACSVAGTYTMPEVFSYETEKMDFSLAGIWVEYTPLTSTSTVNTKINNMTGKNNKYGFIANTIATNANNETSYKTTIQTYINALLTYTNETDANIVGVGVSDDPASEEYQNTVGASIARPQIDDISNTNRTILKITNTNQPEPIKGNAYYDETEEKIKIEVTYRTNAITKIINKKGNILSENSTTADSGEEIIGNGTYRYIVIDNFGNMKQISTKVEGLKIYVIPDLETLKEFRDEVNEGNSFNGITVIQTADISMNEGKYTIDEETGDIAFAEDAEQWEPIGIAGYPEKPFSGTYDGQGHTISGIYINAKENNKGLFGYTEKGAIKNVNLKESQITSTDYYVGGIVGYANETNIENCSNSAQINGDDYVGGICGESNYFDNISKCYNSGKINGGSIVGGIVGGIRGTKKDFNFSNCYNVGEVTGRASVGGICGYFESSSKEGKMSNNYNIGKITATYSRDKASVGGIVGKVDGVAITLSNSYNFGEISGNLGYYVGGIVGYANETNIENCFNNAEITGKSGVGGIVGSSVYGNIKNSYNKGNIISTEEYGIYAQSDVGGIVGRLIYGLVENSYNTGNITGVKYSGGIAGEIYVSSQKIYANKCYNVGDVEGESYIGGCFGICIGTNATIINNYNMGKVEGSSIIGGIIGNNTASISDCYYETGTANTGIGSPASDTGCIATLRDEIIGLIENLEEYKNDEYSINDGYPILSWQTHNDKLNLINGDNAFVEDTDNINGGYPLLAWQVEATN